MSDPETFWVKDSTGPLKDGELERAERWKPVIVVLGEQARFEELVGADRYHDDDEAEEYLTWSQKNPVSIRSSRWSSSPGREPPIAIPRACLTRSKNPCATSWS